MSNAARIGSASEESGVALLHDRPEQQPSDLLKQLLSFTHSRFPNTAGRDWDLTAGRNIKSTYKNALIAIAELKISAKRDTFADVVIIDNETGSNLLADDHRGILRENALTFVRKKIQDQFAFDPGPDHLVSAIQAVAEENRFNPVTDWLDGLSWDGIRRLDTWLPLIAGATDSKLNRAAGALLIKAMIARARYPGSKFDTCLVLEGDQGCGKSSLVRRLSAGPSDGLYVDAPGLIGMNNKDRAELIVGKWIVELAELSGLAKSETEGVKAFLTQPSDRYRAPYAHVAIDRPRTCVFVGTTNSEAYLTDATGNRRFLPVRCATIDLAGLEGVREQLFAEADRQLQGSIVAAGLTVQQDRPLPFTIATSQLTIPAQLWAAAAEAAEDRRTIDPLEEAVGVVLPRLKGKVTTLTNGREFLKAADLLDELRFHFGGSFGTSGLGNWMARLGWSPCTNGPKTARVRGYAR